MGLLKGKDGRWGVSRRLPHNKLGMKRFRRWYEKKAQAKKVLDKLNGAIATGELDEVLPKLVGTGPSDYTVATFYQRWMDEYCKPRLSSWDRYRQSFGFLLPELGAIPLCDFTRGHLHEYMEKRVKAVSPSTCNKDAAAIGKMFSYALEVGAVDHHPLIKFPKFKVQEQALRVPTAEEFREFIETLPTPELQAMMCVIGEAGLRISEARNVTWPMIDMRQKRLLAEKTKGKKVRAVPLSDYAMEKLSALIRFIGNPYVFVYQSGKRMGKRIVKPYKAFNTAKKAAKLDWITPHTLRHMRGTLWLQKGVDIREVQVALGHVSITTTMRYLHHVESHADAAIRQAQRDEEAAVKSSEQRDKSGTKGNEA